jgi:putative membrane protein
MKTTTTLSILLLAGVLACSGCNDADRQKANDIANDAADSLQTKTDTAISAVKAEANKMADQAELMLKGNPDSIFVVRAALDNNMEIRLLQAGVNNGTDQQLVEHAKMMLADHKQLGDQVSRYAAGKGYILVDGDHGKADEELATLSKKNKGSDWDKEWVSALTSGHKAAISLFEKGRDNVKDPELKNMIVSALPNLRSHLDMVEQLRDRMGK